jgi:hypothetical protein
VDFSDGFSGAAGLKKIVQGFHGCYDEEKHNEKPYDDTETYNDW